MNILKKAIAALASAALLSGAIIPNMAVSASAAAVAPNTLCTAHVQSVGWQKAVSGGATSGTTGRSLRLEALKLTLTGAPSGASVTYEAHVQSIGWQKAVSGGAEAGTTGRSLRLEALRITLNGMPGYTVQYRVHVQSLGWLAWQTSSNGTAVGSAGIAGTVGRKLRVEAVQVRIVKTAAVITALEPADVTTEQGTAPALPQTVVAEMSDGTQKNCAVTWDDVDPSEYRDGGQFAVYGTVAGTDLEAEADVNVKGLESWGNGVFLVGTDVPAGDYAVYPGSEDGGLFAITSDLSGNEDSFVGGDFVLGRSLVTLTEGEYFTLLNARMVPLSASDPIDLQGKSLVNGMYLVSGADPERDLPAGTYTVSLSAADDSDTGVYEICSDAGHTEKSVLSEGMVEDGSPATITLQEGQYIELLDCKLSWS